MGHSTFKIDGDSSNSSREVFPFATATQIKEKNMGTAYNDIYVGPI